MKKEEIFFREYVKELEGEGGGGKKKKKKWRISTGKSRGGRGASENPLDFFATTENPGKVKKFPVRKKKRARERRNKKIGI